MRPRVGVTGPDRGGLAAWIFSWLAIRRAGGSPVRITPARPRSTASLDALVIGGGADVADEIEPLDADTLGREDAARSSRWWRRVLAWIVGPLVFVVRWVLATRRRSSHHGDADRDRLELALLREARASGLPTLGICRGAQLMALAQGGTLVRDVASHFVERPQLRTVLPRRRVQICEDTMLRAVLERETLLANSLHRDAVRDVPRPLQVAAIEPDTGIVQAIEDPGMPFWCGVQWHPEYLPQVEVHQRLFDVLVARARLSPQRPRPPAPVAAVLA